MKSKKEITLLSNRTAFFLLLIILVSIPVTLYMNHRLANPAPFWKGDKDLMRETGAFYQDQMQKQEEERRMAGIRGINNPRRELWHYLGPVKDGSQTYYVEGSAVYWGGTKLIGLDLDTYEVLLTYDYEWGSKGYEFAADEDTIYLTDRLLESADVKSFRKTDCEYVYEDDLAWFMLFDEPLRYEKESGSWFEVIDCSGGGYIIDPYTFYKTNSGVYIRSDRLEQADPKTFMRFSDSYSYYRDHDTVWYSNNSDEILAVLDGVHPDQSRIIDHMYLTDEVNVYYEGSRLKNADPNTFFTIDMEGLDLILGRDSDRVYHRDTLLEGIDPNRIYSGDKYGYILRDEDTAWYLTGKCHFQHYVSESEIIEKYGSIEDYRPPC